MFSVGHYTRKGSLSRILFLLVIILASISVNAQVVEPDNILCPRYPDDLGGLALPELPPEDEEYGMGNGIRGNFFPESFSSLYGLHVFGVEVGQPIQANLYLEYIGGLAEPAEADLPVRYFALLDETFIILGENDTLYRDVILPWHKRFTLSILVPPLSEGIHDLVVIGIPSPKGPLRINRNVDDAVTLLSARMTLVAGDLSHPQTDTRPYVKMDEGTFPEGLTTLPENAFFPSLQFSNIYLFDMDETNDLSLEVSPNEVLNFELELGQSYYFADYSYSNERFANLDKTLFALLLLQDYEPVPLNEDGSHVFYGEFPGEYDLVELPVTLTAPESGRQDLVAIRIDFPGLPMCQAIPGIDARMRGIRAIIGTE